MRGHDIVPLVTESRLLEVAAKDLEFGEVWEDPRFHWSIPVHNISDHAVNVTDMSASCTCSAVEPKSFTIQPGQTIPIRLTIDLTRRAPESPIAIRDFELMVRAVSRDEGQAEVRHSWTLKGRIRSGYRVEPRAVDFGDCSIEAEHLPEKSVLVEGLFPLDDLEVKDSGQFFRAQVAPIADRPSNYRVSIVPRAGIPIGEFASEIALRPRSASYPKYPELKVTVTGRTVEDVQCVPNRVDYGSCTMGAVAIEYLTLKSLTGHDFVVEGWDTEGAGLTVERASSSSGVFLVRFAAKEVGEHSGQVRFRVRSSSGRKFELKLLATYVGVRGGPI